MLNFAFTVIYVGLSWLQATAIRKFTGLNIGPFANLILSAAILLLMNLVPLMLMGLLDMRPTEADLISFPSWLLCFIRTSDYGDLGFIPGGLTVMGLVVTLAMLAAGVFWEFRHQYEPDPQRVQEEDAVAPAPEPDIFDEAS